MNVVLVEDELSARRRLKHLISRCRPDVVVSAELSSVEDAVAWFSTGQSADLIFMDIQLTDGISFEIFEEVAVRTPVIFCTAYDEYALRAFKVNSVDYILKPIEETELQAAIEKYEETHRAVVSKPVPDLPAGFWEQLKNTIANREIRHKERFLIKAGSRLTYVPVSEIAGFETVEKTVYLINYAGKRYPIDHSLDELISLLNPQNYFRLNRQMIISLKSIRNVEYEDGKMYVKQIPPLNASLNVSRSRVTEFKNWLGA